MRSRLYTFIFYGVIFSCSSCSTIQYQTLFEQKNSLADTSAATSATTNLNQYRIKPQDILQVRNLQNVQFIVDQAPVSGTGNSSNSGGSSLGQNYQVEENGTVSLPVIGHVPVAGLTRAEAQDTVENRYRKSLLKDPIIELKIMNLKVTLLGEIKSQGNYQLIKDRTTLVEVIGEAGGLTDKADEKTVKIIRGTERNPKVTMINLNDIRSINDPKALLQSGDIVYIAQNKRAIRNDGISNFSTIFQPALLIFNTALIIFTLSRH